MLGCKESTRLLSEAQERRLNWRERLALRFHIMMCRSCRRFEKQMAVIRQAARRFCAGEHEIKRERKQAP